MKVSKGRFAGQDFELEGPISEVMGEDNLAALAVRGLPVALLALREYSVGDEPFYYGKIGPLGHILSHKDLYGTDEA